MEAGFPERGTAVRFRTVFGLPISRSASVVMRFAVVMLPPVPDGSLWTQVTREVRQYLSRQKVSAINILGWGRFGRHIRELTACRIEFDRC